MCLEDLRLGKGRFPGKPVTGAASVPIASLLPADGRRVAVIISFYGILNNGAPSDVLSLFYEGAPIAQPFMQIPMTNGPVILKIEELGLLVQGAILYTMTDLTSLAANIVTATPILTNVIAESIPSPA